MPFIPNLRSKKPVQEYVKQNIDVLVNYGDFLQAADAAGGVVTGLDDPGQYRVAVVGSGPAG